MWPACFDSGPKSNLWLTFISASCWAISDDVHHSNVHAERIEARDATRDRDDCFMIGHLCVM